MDYQKQGKDFLTKHGIKFSAKFIKYDLHFADDKEPRDIFKVTFSRDKKKFSIRFGESLNDSTGNGDNSPTPYDVLACLTKYEPGTFENFCGDFGYDTDSRKAEKIYKNVCKEWEKVSGFFTGAEIEELSEIQ